MQIRLKSQRLEEEKAEEMSALTRLHLSDMEQAERQMVCFFIPHRRLRL
jgi:hypothetical protein